MKRETQTRATMFLACGFALFCAILPTISALAINVNERTNTTERLPATVKIHAVQLNQNAFDYAKELIKQGYVVADGRGAWSQHQPSAEEENEFIRLHGFSEYAKWHLGIDDAHAENTKARYNFPMAISKISIVALCLLPKAGPADTNITTSKMPHSS